MTHGVSEWFMGARIERRSNTHAHVQIPRLEFTWSCALADSLFFDDSIYISCCYACEVSVGVCFEGGPVADAVAVSVL